MQGVDGLEVGLHRFGVVPVVGMELDDADPCAGRWWMVLHRTGCGVVDPFVGSQWAFCDPQLVEHQTPPGLFEHGPGLAVEHEVGAAVGVGGGHHPPHWSHRSPPTHSASPHEPPGSPAGTPASAVLPGTPLPEPPT